MGNDWIRGAVKLNPSPGHTNGLAMLGGPPRAVLHRTVGQGFEGNAAFLAREGFEVQVLWDPFTGQIGQYFPLSRGGYGLMHKGVETNVQGTACIQIEVCDYGRSFNITDSPMKNWDAILEGVRSWGIPDHFPLGPCSPLNGPRAGGDATVWLNQAGWYGHCHVPGNEHVDPGTIDSAKLFGIDTTGLLNMDEKTFKKWVAEVVDSRVKIILNGIEGDPTHQYSLKQIKQELDDIKSGKI